jgi:hypothetical protein
MKPHLRQLNNSHETLAKRGSKRTEPLRWSKGRGKRREGKRKGVWSVRALEGKADGKPSLPPRPTNMLGLSLYNPLSAW